jgi:hypothetical protein
MHLHRWYWFLRRAFWRAEDYEEVLQGLQVEMRDYLELLVVEGSGVRLGIPKLHRCTHIADVIRRYGPYVLVSTDVFELSHQPLKAVFTRYMYIAF